MSAAPASRFFEPSLFDVARLADAVSSEPELLCTMCQEPVAVVEVGVTLESLIAACERHFDQAHEVPDTPDQRALDMAELLNVLGMPQFVQRFAAWVVRRRPWGRS